MFSCDRTILSRTFDSKDKFDTKRQFFKSYGSGDIFFKRGLTRADLSTDGKTPDTKELLNTTVMQGIHGMYVRACMRVWVHVCVRVCLYMRACVFLCIYVCACVRVHVCVRACARAPVCVCVFICFLFFTYNTLCKLFS